MCVCGGVGGGGVCRIVTWESYLGARGFSGMVFGVSVTSLLYCHLCKKIY